MLIVNNKSRIRNVENRNKKGEKQEIETIVPFTISIESHRICNFDSEVENWNDGIRIKQKKIFFRLIFER